MSVQDDHPQSITRRAWLITGGVVLGGGLFAGGHTAWKRRQLKGRMTAAAEPLLSRKAHLELTNLPEAATSELKTWFAGPCLNAAEFVHSRVDNDFLIRLFSLRTNRERAEFFLAKFFTHVVSAEEILNKIRQIARRSGRALDANWRHCCDRIETDWGTYLEPHDVSFSDRLVDRLEPGIRQALVAAAASAGDDAAQVPIVKALDIKRWGGEAALLLFKVARSPAAGNVLVPLFLIRIGLDLAIWLEAQRRRRHTVARVQRAMTSRISMLGVNVAEAFGREVRQRISDLHDWQRETVDAAAESCSERAIGLFS